MPGGGSEKTLMGVRQEESSAESKESPPPEPHPLQQESFGEQRNWKAGLMAGPLCILVIWILEMTPRTGQSLRPLALIPTAMCMQSLCDEFKNSPIGVASVGTEPVQELTELQTDPLGPTTNSRLRHQSVNG